MMPLKAKTRSIDQDQGQRNEVTLRVPINLVKSAREGIFHFGRDSLTVRPDPRTETS